MNREQARREIDSLDFYLQNHTDDYGEESHTAMMMAIEALSSSEKPNKWIPVSERLPGKSGNYWCTFGGTNLTGKDYYTTESDAKEIFDEPEEYAGWQSQNVIAWIPLPDPYKASPTGSEGAIRNEGREIRV